MKKPFQLWLSIGIAAALLGVFTVILFAHAHPMEDRMYDMSIVNQHENLSAQNDPAQWGWTVFTQEGDERKELSPVSASTYGSLAYPGQTFYFARVMQEPLDAPLLQLGTANRNFAVFLNDELIYTDCPELDNRIGYLTLPTRDLDKKENVSISLPEDYLGKTLTIAQSTPKVADSPSMATRALPCSVRLYCGYAYESALIAESFQTAIVGVIGLVLGAGVLLIFLRQTALGKGDAGLVCLSLACFFAMASHMYEASYVYQYFSNSMMFSDLFSLLATLTLQLFLISRSGRMRWLLWLMTGCYVPGIVLYAYFNGKYPATFPLPDLLTYTLPTLLMALTLLITLVLAWIFWRRDRFYRPFAMLTTAGIALFFVIHLILPSRVEFFKNAYTTLANLAIRWPMFALANYMTVIALGVTAAQFIHEEAERHAEKRLAAQQHEWIQRRYENLRAYHDDVMMLRHDMNRHFQLLRQMTTEEKAVRYLDELIGQSEKIRPFVQSGNETLDVILCGRLASAVNDGIRVDMVRAHAPEKLPLSDTELCSLTMNLLDNAIAAARTSGAEAPYIKLDFHVKNNFFLFTCENSASAESLAPQQEEPAHEHGLGLRIVRQISQRYGDLMQIERGRGYYKTSLAIPLAQPIK